MVANVADLRDRLLKPGGLILPSRFELYCEPVMVSDERRVPFLWELNVHGYDYSCLERNRPEEPEYYRCAASTAVSSTIPRRTGAVADCRSAHANEADLPRTALHSHRRAAGRLDGFAVYFRARSTTTSASAPARWIRDARRIGVFASSALRAKTSPRRRDRSQAHVGRCRTRTPGAGATRNAPARTGARAPVRSGKASCRLAVPRLPVATSVSDYP